MKLHVCPSCPNSATVLVASKLSTAEVEIVWMEKASLKSKEFLALSPCGKVPVLVTQNGVLFEANSIARYLLRVGPTGPQYLGSNEYLLAQTEQWCEYTSSSLLPHVGTILCALSGAAPYNKEDVALARTKVKTALDTLEATLKVSAYLVGSSLSIADITVACQMTTLLRFVLEEKYIKNNFPSFTKWYDNVSRIPAFVAVWGSTRYCTKPMEFPLPIQKSEPKPKQEVAAKPKAEAAKPKVEEEKPKPKEEDPLEKLPKSTMDMNAFKFMFVNEKDRALGLKKMWEMFDYSGWSFWYLTYEKAEGEGKVVFLTSNMVGGFLQRCDHFRKWAFGTHGVYGDEPNLEIRGLWMWRGLEKMPQWKMNDMADYYTFVKLDPTKAEDKAKIEEYWSKMDEGEICDGLKCQDVRWFK